MVENHKLQYERGVNMHEYVCMGRTDRRYVPVNNPSKGNDNRVNPEDQQVIKSFNSFNVLVKTLDCEMTEREREREREHHFVPIQPHRSWLM